MDDADRAGKTERAGLLLGERARSNVPLAPISTYRVGGSAALFSVVESPADLEKCAIAVAETGIEVLVVGNGSNLLVADAGFPGLVIQLGEAFRTVDRDGTVVRAGGAALLPVVARRSVGFGLAGFEWAVGVPGSIGGAVRMNAGGHGADMASCLLGVRVFDVAVGENYEVDADALDLGYRRSNLQPTQVVTEARLQLRPLDAAAQPAGEEAGADLLAAIVRWRRTHQPGGQNAGSVFTNPPGTSAGQLIDDAGCRGLRHGTAEVSIKHANFIQADPGGSADDVFALMQQVMARVAERTGVTLHPETVLVGFGDQGGSTRAVR